MASDPLSAAAKPLCFPYEESIESRSARKGKRSPAAGVHQLLPVPLLPFGRADSPSDSASEGATTPCSTSDEEFFASKQPLKQSAHDFATSHQQSAAARPMVSRARRNSLGKVTLVTLNRGNFSLSPNSLDDDLQRTIDRAVENASTDVDLSHRNIQVLPECIGDLRHCTSLNQSLSLSKRSFRKSHSAGSLEIRNTHSSQLNLQLPGNLLTSASFPSAFFDIHNITVLSLRNNRLDTLPEGICALVNLKTLNISSNRLQYLPASINNLELDSFLCQPNDFLPVAEEASVHSSSKRLLGVKSVRQAVPSLVESCQRLLLSRLDSAVQGRVLAQHAPHLAAALSADASNSSHKHRKCSNPAHATKPAMVEAAVERMEWCRTVAGCVVGVPEVPLLFRGCQRTCLDFLEEVAYAPVDGLTSAEDDAWVL